MAFGSCCSFLWYSGISLWCMTLKWMSTRLLPDESAVLSIQNPYPPIKSTVSNYTKRTRNVLTEQDGEITWLYPSSSVYISLRYETNKPYWNNLPSLVHITLSSPRLAGFSTLSAIVPLGYLILAWTFPFDLIPAGDSHWRNDTSVSAW